MKYLLLLLGIMTSNGAWADPVAVHRNFKDPLVAELTLAAGSGDSRTVRRLAAQGVDPASEGVEGLTPIVWAIGQHNEAGVQALIDVGVSPSFCPRRPPCIHAAAAQGQKSWLLLLLLRNGLDPNSRPGNESLLRLAILGGAHENVDILLDSGADIETQDFNGATPIILAARLNQFALVMHLIERGADYRKRDSTNDSVARLAAERKLNPKTKAFADQKKLKEWLVQRGDL